MTINLTIIKDVYSHIIFKVKQFHNVALHFEFHPENLFQVRKKNKVVIFSKNANYEYKLILGNKM